jgi:uncharacterized protein YraI
MRARSAGRKPCDPPIQASSAPESTARRRRLPLLVAATLLLWLGAIGPAAAQDEAAEPTSTPIVDLEQEEEQPVEEEPAAEEDETAPAAESTETPVADDDAAEEEGATDDVPAEPADAGRIVYRVVEDLNLRAEPSLDAEILTVMPAGSNVTAAAADAPENDFLPVRFEEEEGWAAVAYLAEGSASTEETGSSETTGSAGTVASDLNLRAEPSLDAEVIEVMPAGAEVRVIGSAEDADGNLWTNVLYGDIEGWASSEFVVPSEEDDAASTAASSASSSPADERIALVDLNLRAGPSTADEILLVIPAGGSMSLTGEGAENGFVTVLFDGTSGWVAAEFIARPDELAGSAPSEASVDEESSATDETSAAGESSANGESSAYVSQLAGQTRVTLTDLNLRAGPSTADEVLLVIPAGATVTLTGDGLANDFATVDYEGTIGWAAVEFLGE